jgi:agmatine deiminase
MESSDGLTSRSTIFSLFFISVTAMTLTLCATALLLIFMFGRNCRPAAAGKTIVVIRDPDNVCTMPAEEEPHEGTWLQWPHDYGWDNRHIERLEESWIQITQALHTGERVHIIVYDLDEEQRVKSVLESRGLKMSQLDFYAWPTDDVWVRDNGPIFVFDQEQRLCIENWKFNGWGNMADSWFDDYIPIHVGNALNLPVISVPMVNEGGSIEVDGRGTLMAKRSSIMNNNRNPGWTQSDAEAYFCRYLGVTHFIWLDGIKGGDITDDHIDGTARFANSNTIVTSFRRDFLRRSEYDTLKNAKDAHGTSYEMVHLPITTRKIAGVGDYGIYMNYYVGNEVVVIPSFDDPNDVFAAETLKGLYPNRRLVPVNMVELYKDGGMVHCVTQQQPKEYQK